MDDYEPLGDQDQQRGGARSALKRALALGSVCLALYLVYLKVVPPMVDPRLIEKAERDDDSVGAAAGPCEKYKGKDACNGDSSCTWCVSFAIPSACYDLKKAKDLPNPVFVCDKKTAYEEMTEEESTSLRSVPPVVELDVKEIDSAPEGDDVFCDTVKQIAGYIRLPGTRKNYFFWFFESRSNPGTDPLVIFLSGGPGCSSEIALFGELGPCSIDSSTIKTKTNKYSWNSNANLMFIDQPTGTGFSYGGENDHNEKDVGNEIYWFLINFMGKYNQYSKLPVHLFGESYGGHYVPAIAHRIWLGNKKKEGPININLKGVGVGNGMTNPFLQFPAFPDMAYTYSDKPRRVPESVYHAMQRAVPKCTALIALCNAVGGMFCDTALNYCGEALIFPVQAEGWNQYDLRIKCQKAPLCYDFAPVAAFLNKPETRTKLNIPTTVRKWEECSNPVNRRFHKDWMHNFDHLLPELLNDGIAVLIYAGDADYICNWKGNKVWTLALEWKQAEAFRTAKDVEWNNKAGKLRQAGPFSFLQVYNAGHMVPMDQPKASLDMLNQFTKGTLKLNVDATEEENID